MTRCGRCDSGDTRVVDASDPDGFTVVCMSCGLVEVREELT